MLAAGAAMVDVGGMTAQPGTALGEDEEAVRVVPTVSGIRAAAPDAVISVDTYRAPVAAAALDAGADVVNDHTGGADPALATAVAERDAGLVVTHLGLQPKQVQDGRYELTVDAIAESLLERAAAAEAAGVRRDAILLDPGLGFGKSTATDLACLRHLDRLTGLGYPLLLACSHKEVTAEPLGLPEANLEGTAAVVAVAAHGWACACCASTTCRSWSGSPGWHGWPARWRNAENRRSKRPAASGRARTPARTCRRRRSARRRRRSRRRRAGRRPCPSAAPRRSSCRVSG